MLKIRSIKAKFQVYLTLVILLIIVSSNIIILQFIDTFTYRNATHNTIRWCRDFESLLEPNFIYYNYMNLLSQIEEVLSERREDFVTLYTSNRSEIIHRGIEFKEQSPPDFPGEITQRKVEIEGTEYILITLPVKTRKSETVWGYIRYGRSLHDRVDLLSKIKTHLLYLSVALFLLSALLLRIFINRTTQPIKALRKGLEMMSYGNLSYRIQVDSNDEFTYLADRFNEMGEKLETIMKEIEKTQKDLEHQIRERTKTLDETNKKLHSAMEELKSTQDKIIQSEKQKSLTAIVSGFAHEINNPLTGILGYIDLMEMRDDLSPYIKDKLRYIKLQSNRIKDIITELNQLNPEVEQTKLEINLNNLIDKLIKILGTKKENQDIQFTTEFTEQDVVIFGNHFSLWQAFEGIIENAIEAIHDKGIEPGHVLIKLKKSVDRSRVIVEILDNGGGFENPGKAFDPFYTTKSRSHKKGIGLSIAFNLVQEHRGSIIIKNHEAGATVSVFLPLSADGRRSENDVKIQ